MALTFGGATSDRVDCGSAAGVDDLSALTVMLWVYPTALTSDRALISKYRGATEQGWQVSLQGGGVGNIELYRERATTDQQYRTSGEPVVTNAWQFVAVASDSTDAKIFHGNLTTLATEASYGTATGGSGAFNSDASRQLLIANRDAPTPNAAFPGRIAIVSLLNVKLTLAEIQMWQFTPRVLPNMIGMWVLGYNGTSTQPDYSGNANNGTVTGATVSDHVPIVFRRHGQLYVPYAVAAGGGGSDLLLRLQTEGLFIGSGGMAA